VVRRRYLKVSKVFLQTAPVRPRFHEVGGQDEASVALFRADEWQENKRQQESPEDTEDNPSHGADENFRRRLRGQPVEGDPTRIPGSDHQGMRVSLRTCTLQAHQDDRTKDRKRSQR